MRSLRAPAYHIGSVDFKHYTMKRGRLNTIKNTAFSSLAAVGTETGHILRFYRNTSNNVVFVYVPFVWVDKIITIMFSHLQF